MALTKNISTNLKIKDIIRIDHFDSRYYKILYEIIENKKKKLTQAYLPSVTEILNAYPKPFLAKWRGDVGNDRADQIMIEALNLGSTIHNGAEYIAQGSAVVYNPYSKPIYSEDELKKLQKKYKKIFICRFQKEFIQLYRIWELFEALNPSDIEIEQTVYSLAHKFAGTLDLMCYIKEGEYNIAGSVPLYLEEGIYVADYKTGKGIDKTYKMQISAYMQAVIEGMPELSKKIKGGLIIHPNNEKITTGIKGLKTTLVTMQEQREYFNSFMKVYDVYKIDKPVPSPTEFSMPTILSYITKKVSKKK